MVRSSSNWPLNEYKKKNLPLPLIFQGRAWPSSIRQKREKKVMALLQTKNIKVPPFWPSTFVGLVSHAQHVNAKAPFFCSTNRKNIGNHSAFCHQRPMATLTDHLHVGAQQKTWITERNSITMQSNGRRDQIPKAVTINGASVHR